MTRSLEPVSDKKIITVVGAERSGKTCLTKRLVGEDASSSLSQHTSTLDESYYTSRQMPNGALERLQFIDTAPWLEFPVMHRLYIKTCHLVMIVYDVTSSNWRQSLRDLIQQVKQIKDDVEILVVGTHADEHHVHMNFTPAHVQEVIGSLPHAYVSSVSGFGINNLWHTMATRTRLSNLGSNTSIKVPIESRHTISKKSPSMKKLIIRTGSFLLCTSKYHTL